LSTRFELNWKLLVRSVGGHIKNLFSHRYGQGDGLLNFTENFEALGGGVGEGVGGGQGGEGESVRGRQGGEEKGRRKGEGRRRGGRRGRGRERG